MRIGLISRGRTCSTAILQSLIKKYGNLINNHEIYSSVTRNLPHDYYELTKLSSGTCGRIDRFKNKMIQFTNKLWLDEHFICKIWPSMFIARPHKILDPFADTKEKIIFDITTYIKIKEYDKLYFLDRDLYKSATSWTYSMKSMIWKKHPYPPTITLESKDYDTAKFYILEYCLQHKMKTFLIENNIPFTDIGTNPKPYIDPTVTIQKSNNDYRQLITNYDELHSFITDYYQICVDNTKDWYYV